VDKAGFVPFWWHRLEFVREACKPTSFMDNTWKPTGYKVTEISWGVVQKNGHPYMQPGIKTELTLEHSDGEDFVHEQDRRKSGLETVRQKVSHHWQVHKVWMQLAVAVPEVHYLQLKFDFKQLSPILKCIICRLVLPANSF